MTMTTETPNRHAPAWLDVDRLVPGELLKEIQAYTAAMIEIHAQLEPLARTFARLSADNETAEDVAVSDLKRLFGGLDESAATGFGQVVCVLTGWRDAFTITSAVCELFAENL